MALRSFGLEGTSPTNNNSPLQSLLLAKQRALHSQLASLPSPLLQIRLTSLPPSPSPHLLLSTLRRPHHTSLIAEVARLSPSEMPDLLVSRCQKYVRLGVDAIAIRTDEESSPDGLADLEAVCNSLQVPVIQRDWFIHPLQIAETRESGAAALTLVHAILQNGLPSLQSYAHSLGLDPIVEIVNLKDLEAASKLGSSLYGINLSIKLSLSVPGLQQDVAKSLVRQLPAGAQGIVGIVSVEEALEMKLAGATAIYLRHDVLQSSEHGEPQDEVFLEKLRGILSSG